ncbi:hypothetical protein MLD52_14200 [Puniceicoccaceae bacterium K14]|nr:hypothetical protein [Puniceicoccaceae bacterium K14]
MLSYSSNEENGGFAFFITLNIGNLAGTYRLLGEVVIDSRLAMFDIG